MRLAIEEAKKALAHHDVPVGCILVRNGEIISQAHNEREKRNDPTAHAEILALKKAGEILKDWHLNDLELYVTLEPCPMCAGALLNARIKTIIYGADEKVWGACGSNLNLVQFPVFPHNIRIRPNVLEEECRLLLENFFKMIRKENK